MRRLPAFLLLLSLLAGSAWAGAGAPPEPAPAAASTPMVAPTPARARIARADAALAAVRTAKIDGPGAGTTLGRKQQDQLLTSQLVAAMTATKALEAACAHEDTESTALRVALLVRLAEGARAFAAAVTTSWVPPYLTEDQRALYGMALEDKAYPYWEKHRYASQRALALLPELPGGPESRELVALALRAARHDGPAGPPDAVCPGDHRYDRYRRSERSYRRVPDWKVWEASAVQMEKLRDALPACMNEEAAVTYQVVVEQGLPIIRQHEDSLLQDVIPFLEDALRQVYDGWCDGPPPARIDMPPKGAWLTVPHDPLPDVYLRTGWPLQLPGWPWNDPREDASSGGPIATQPALALRLQALRAWVLPWQASLGPPRQTTTHPDAQQLRAWGDRVDQRLDAVATLEADASPLLALPSEAAATRILLAQAWLDALDDVLALDGPRAELDPKGYGYRLSDRAWLARAATRALVHAERLTHPWLTNKRTPPTSPDQRARIELQVDALIAHSRAVVERQEAFRERGCP